MRCPFFGVPFEENTVSKSKGVGVQIEVSFSWRIVGGFPSWPNHRRKVRARDTVLGIAEIVVCGGIGPYPAVTWLRWVADKSW